MYYNWLNWIIDEAKGIMSQSLTIVQNLQHYDKTQFTILLILKRAAHTDAMFNYTNLGLHISYVHSRPRASLRDISESSSLAIVLKIKEYKQADTTR